MILSENRSPLFGIMRAKHQFALALLALNGLLRE
jgi:hypothetical protein